MQKLELEQGLEQKELGVKVGIDCLDKIAFCAETPTVKASPTTYTTNPVIEVGALTLIRNAP